MKNSCTSFVLLNEGVIPMTIDISRGLLVGVIFGLIFTPMLAPHVQLITLFVLVLSTGVVGLKK